jgi:hypothetical protein
LSWALPPMHQNRNPQPPVSLHTLIDVAIGHAWRRGRRVFHLTLLRSAYAGMTIRSDWMYSILRPKVTPTRRPVANKGRTKARDIERSNSMRPIMRKLGIRIEAALAAFPTPIAVRAALGYCGVEPPSKGQPGRKRCIGYRLPAARFAVSARPCGDRARPRANAA